MYSIRFKVSGNDFIPDKPVLLFQQPPLVGGTTVRASYDVAPDGRFLLNQAIPEGVDDRNRKIFPSTLRVILNWNDEVNRLVDSQ
jgi:hypothetical protein